MDALLGQNSICSAICSAIEFRLNLAHPTRPLYVHCELHWRCFYLTTLYCTCSFFSVETCGNWSVIQMYGCLFGIFLVFVDEFSCPFWLSVLETEIPEKKRVPSSLGLNYNGSLGAGGRGMGTPLQLCNNDKGSRCSFWRSKFVPVLRKVFILKHTPLELSLSYLGTLWVNWTFL